MRLSTPNSSAGISMKPATIEMNVRTTGSAPADRHRPHAAPGEEAFRAVDVGVR